METSSDKIKIHYRLSVENPEAKNIYGYPEAKNIYGYPDAKSVIEVWYRFKKPLYNAKIAVVRQDENE